MTQQTFRTIGLMRCRAKELYEYFKEEYKDFDVKFEIHPRPEGRVAITFRHKTCKCSSIFIYCLEIIFDGEELQQFCSSSLGGSYLIWKYDNWTDEKIKKFVEDYFKDKNCEEKDINWRK